jgi:hypothetical protein
MNHPKQRIHVWLLLFAAYLGLTLSLVANPKVLFETGFEKFEGYAPNQELVGQGGWVGVGSGGNGVLGEPLDGFHGQYAYIGFAGPTNASDAFNNVWHPVGLQPVGGDLPVVQFSVSLQIQDSSTNAPYFDDFRWSFYGVDASRLFSIDFDNDTRLVNFVLDDGSTQQPPPFRPTGYSFHNGTPYDLLVTLNLGRNLWTASINGAVIVNSQPITTKVQPLTLGDIDAVWAIRNPQTPGDNYMLFDDYRIEATALTEIPPTVEVIGPLATNGAFLVRIYGEPGVHYVLEATSDFKTWVSVASGDGPKPGGILDLQDASAGIHPHRYYRASSTP